MSHLGRVRQWYLDPGEDYSLDEHALGKEGLKRCVVIVSTGDEAPLLRVRAAKVACTVAEFFRDRGNNVLLMMDSLTRLCQAQGYEATNELPAKEGVGCA